MSVSTSAVFIPQTHEIVWWKKTKTGTSRPPSLEVVFFLKDQNNERMDHLKGVWAQILFPTCSPKMKRVGYAEPTRCLSFSICCYYHRWPPPLLVYQGLPSHGSTVAFRYPPHSIFPVCRLNASRREARSASESGSIQLPWHLPPLRPVLNPGQNLRKIYYCCGSLLLLLLLFLCLSYPAVYIMYILPWN